MKKSKKYYTCCISNYDSYTFNTSRNINTSISKPMLIYTSTKSKRYKYIGIFNKKVTENSIDGFEKSGEEGEYNVYKNSYVMVIDTEENI